MPEPGDLVVSKWVLDVKTSDKWNDTRVHDKKHRIGIVLSIADRKTLRKKDIFWVKWTDEFLPRKSLMISTEIEILNKK